MYATQPQVVMVGSPSPPPVMVMQQQQPQVMMVQQQPQMMMMQQQQPMMMQQQPVPHTPPPAPAAPQQSGTAACLNCCGSTMKCIICAFVCLVIIGIVIAVLFLAVFVSAANKTPVDCYDSNYYTTDCQGGDAYYCYNSSTRQVNCPNASSTYTVTCQDSNYNEVPCYLPDVKCYTNIGGGIVWTETTCDFSQKSYNDQYGNTIYIK
jgi:hypothetical protein